MTRVLRRLSIWMTLGLLVTACAASSPALAASAETTPVVSGNLDVQLWPGAMAGQGVAIMALSLPEDTALPARVRIPVPAGSSVDWAGEIGADAGEDVERPYEIKTGAAGSYAQFDLLSSRQAQLEVSGLPLNTTGGVYSIVLEYVQTTPADVTAFSVRLPSGARDVTITPSPAAPAQQNQMGESLFTLPSAELTVGEAHRVTAAYRLGSETTSTPGAGSAASSSTVLGVLIGAIVLVLLVLLVVVQRERSRRGDQ